MKKLLVLGGGESGTGAALLGKKLGYEVLVSDSGIMAITRQDELNKAEITFEMGGHSLAAHEHTGLVIKSPGIAPETPIVQQLMANGAEIIDELEFSWRHYGGKVIAITGTNGKTTTTLLTYHLLKACGLNVGLAGNVGQSFARQLALGADFEWVVLEVSSFQLDGMPTFRPEIGCLLNITPDHLDRYETMENYVGSKFQMQQSMLDTDVFIVGVDSDEVAKKLEAGPLSPARKLRFSKHAAEDVNAWLEGGDFCFHLWATEYKFPQNLLPIPGHHNKLNALVALSAARLAGCHWDKLREVLPQFINAPHRLEPVATVNGITFVNDSKATNVDSVVYALQAYTQPIVWIVGGKDKGNDYTELDFLVDKHVKDIVCLGAKNQRLLEHFGQRYPAIADTNTVEAAIQVAYAKAAPGDVILLSPACASFDLFQNYEDRGDQFRAGVLAFISHLG